MRAMLSQSRIISDRKPERLRVRPANALNNGPAFSSSHCRQSLISHAGGGPLFGAVSSPLLKVTAQHGTARHSTAQHGTARHSTAQHGTARHSTAQHGTARHSTAQHGTARHSTARYGVEFENESTQTAWKI